MKTIAAAFVKAKRAFAPAVKDKTNPAFRSKYADLGACIDAVEDALLANGIAAYHETSEDPSGVTVETVMLHECGEALRFGKLHVPAAKQDPQGYGSALTYARRYSLMAACGIAPEDDDGNAGSRRATAREEDLVPVLEASIEQARQKKQGVMGAALTAVESFLDGPTKTGLAKLAFEVGDVFKREGAALAFDRIEIEELNDEERVYLWSLMPSNLRSALKTEKQHRAMTGVPN